MTQRDITLLLKREGNPDRTEGPFATAEKAVRWASANAWPMWAWWVMPGSRTWQDFPREWSRR
jgi:hypothetical protein